MNHRDVVVEVIEMDKNVLRLHKNILSANSPVFEQVEQLLCKVTITDVKMKVFNVIAIFIYLNYNSGLNLPIVTIGNFLLPLPRYVLMPFLHDISTFFILDTPHKLILWLLLRKDVDVEARMAFHCIYQSSHHTPNEGAFKLDPLTLVRLFHSQWGRKLTILSLIRGTFSSPFWPIFILCLCDYL